MAMLGEKRRRLNGKQAYKPNSEPLLRAFVEFRGKWLDVKSMTMVSSASRGLWVLPWPVWPAAGSGFGFIISNHCPTLRTEGSFDELLSRYIGKKVSVLLGREESALRASMVLHATLGRVHTADDRAYFSRQPSFGKLCHAALSRAKMAEARNAWTVAALLQTLAEEDDLDKPLEKRVMSVLLTLARSGDEKAKKQAFSAICTMIDRGLSGGLAHHAMPLALGALKGSSEKLQLEALRAVEAIGSLTKKRTALVSTGGMRVLVELLREGSPAVQQGVVDTVASFLYVETCRLQFSAEGGFQALVDLALRIKESEIEEDWAQMLIYELSRYPLHRDLKDLLQGHLPSTIRHLWRAAWLAGHLQLVCDVLKIWQRAVQICPEHAGAVREDARQTISDMVAARESWPKGRIGAAYIAPLIMGGHALPEDFRQDLEKAIQDLSAAL